MRRRLAGLVVFGLLAAACTSQAAPERESLPQVAAPTTTTTSPIVVSQTDTARLADVAGRMLVLREDSSIVSMRADGSGLTEHAPPADADDGGRIIERSEPTWSPDGSQLAWTEHVGEDAYELVIASADGAEVSRTTSPMLAQYLDWAPDAGAIAFMGNDFFGAMTLAHASAGDDAEIIDSGAPMYIDWSPTGERLLVHVEDRLEQIDPAGTLRERVDTEGQFRVGLYYGSQLLYSIPSGGLGEVLIANEIPGNPRPILAYSSPAAIVVEPRTGRIAAMSTWNAEAVKFAEDPPTDFPALVPEQLSIVDPATGELVVIHEGRAVSWSWNPDGSVLLFSTLEYIEDSQKIVWHSWDGADVTRYSHFTPTSRFGNSYLAFFDQHERSTTRWSPDGEAFVYAGGIIDGPRGIWVQPLDDGEPILVTDGINATWSP
jgi:hypothetical protein